MTGLPSLDRLLGGGLPAHQTIIVGGDPGTGKTVLCSQIAFARARRGIPVVYATITSESNDKLLSQLRGFRFFDEERVGNELFLISAYGWIARGPSETKDGLLRAVRERKAGLLVIDGLRSVRDLWKEESQLRNFLYELTVGLSQLGCQAILTAEYPLETLLGYPEATTVDGILSMSVRRFGEWSLRRIQVVKLRGCNHLVGEHVMHITGEGVQIIPRLEATLPRDYASAAGSVRQDGELARAAFGLPELDALLEGGLPRSSATLMAGSTGVGKSLMALYFAAAGARDREPSLYVSYSEPPASFRARARGVGLPVDELIESGLLRIIYRPLVEVESDDLADEILHHVRDMGAQRLVIDGIGELESAVSNEARSRAFLTALIVHLRSLAVTSIFIKEVPKLVGPDLDFSDTPIAVTAENMLFLRHQEHAGRLHRFLSVLKVRASNFDPHLREFTIDDTGIHVLGGA